MPESTYRARLQMGIGVALIALGVLVLWMRPTYPVRQDVLQIGDFKASVDQREPIPAWWGAASAAAGTVLLFAASKRRNG